MTSVRNVAKLASIVISASLFACVPEESDRQSTGVEAELIGISETYTGETNVLPQADWAMFLCMPTPTVHEIRRSRALGDAVHGRKLYTLYTNEPDMYARAGSVAEQPVVFDDGFFVVKESWTPEPLGDEKPEHGGHHVRGKDGRWYTLGEKSHLFMMLKRGDLPAESTDNGWVYAVVRHDGSEVIESGRIESCMECHASATTDRLFGLSDADRDSLRERLGLRAGEESD